MAIVSAPPKLFSWLLCSMLFYYNYNLQECAQSKKQQLPIIYVIF